MEITVHSTEETKKLAKEIAKDIGPGTILALYGELGSGKTTFTRFLVDALGIKSRVQSPTFIIHRVYGNGIIKINHFDLYRVSTIDELHDMGFIESLSDTTALTIIEWPNIAEDILKKYKNRLINIHFDYISEDSRRIAVKKHE